MKSFFSKFISSEKPNALNSPMENDIVFIMNGLLSSSV